MTQCNSFNENLSNSQRNKLKSAIKNETEIILERMSSNKIGNFDDETNFPHKILSANRHAANLRKVFSDNSSVNIKLSKTQLSKRVQTGRFLGRTLGLLLKTGLPVMKNVIKPLPKSFNYIKINSISISSRFRKKQKQS